MLNEQSQHLTSAEQNHKQEVLSIEDSRPQYRHTVGRSDRRFVTVHELPFKRIIRSEVVENTRLSWATQFTNKLPLARQFFHQLCHNAP
jgi:hypothetical protein